MIKSTTEDSLLHDKFVNYGINAKGWMKKCVLLLPEIAKRRIWEKKGFSSIHEYAAKLAGMSHAKVDEALWILKKIENKPDLKRIIEIKGIESIKPIITIANDQNAKFWAEKARKMSRNTLRVFVKEFRKQSSENELPSENNQNIFMAGHKTNSCLFDQQAVLNKEIITMELDKKLADKLKKLKGNSEWNNLLQQLIDIREKQLELEKQDILKNQKNAGTSVKTQASKSDSARCSSTAKTPGGVQAKTVKSDSARCSSTAKTHRRIPNKIKRHVLAKTNGTCAFPACVKPAEILHHTKRFALISRVDVKAHADTGNAVSGNAFVHHPDFIAPLCKEHERLAHFGLIENEDGPPEKWKIRGNPDTEYLNSEKFIIDKIVNRFRGGFSRQNNSLNNSY